MSRRADTPPTTAESLLRLFIPGGLKGSSILGDLTEEYRAVRAAGGAVRADLWYWFHAFLLAAQYSLPNRLGRPSQSSSPSTGRKAGASIMDSLLQDVRFAARSLLRRAGFTAVVVATFAVGIGATVAMFSVINSVLLQPPPYEDPDRLVFGTRRSQSGTGGYVSGLDYFDYREQNDVFESLAAIRGFGVSVTVTGTEGPERVNEMMISSDLFSTLGVAPVLGRDLAREEGNEDAAPAVILSHGFWERRFGGAEDVVGRILVVDEQPHTVIGVMPRQFDFPEGTEIWRPMRRNGPWADSRGPQNWFVIGRLRDGVSVALAQEQMDAICARLAEIYPETNSDRGLHLSGFHERLVQNVRPTLLILTGVVGIVLLIVCANVAGLLLARGIARSGEMAVRAALGASRTRLIRQLVAESVLVSIAGGLLGLAFAHWLFRVLEQLAPADVPGIKNLAINGTVLLIALVVSMTTGLTVGLVPAFRSASADVTGKLVSGHRSCDASGGARLRGMLVVGQVALSIVLLVNAGLLMRSFLRLQAVDPGFQADGLLTAEITLPREAYSSGQEVSRYYNVLLDKTVALPGVISAAGISRLPIAGAGGDYPVYPEDNPPADPSEGRGAIVRSVTPDYFNTMRIPLLAGRTLSEHDTEEASPVVVVDEALVRRDFSGQNPVGKILMLGFRQPVPLEIVGVVGEVRGSSLNSDPEPTIYFSIGQWPERTMSVVLRTGNAPLSFTNTLRATVGELDPNVPVARIATMRQLVSDSVAEPRTTMWFLLAFAATALLLAALGLYGVLAYTVHQRGHEIGVRIALGAGRGEVVRMVLLRGLLLVGLGFLLGFGGALATTRFVRSLLFDVATTDVLTFLAVSLVLATVAVIACLLPAWKAARIDPLEAIRSE